VVRKKKVPERTIKIENVVASASLEHEVDIKAIAKVFPLAEYRPEVFPGLVFRLKKPKTATLIFESGKMVCTGGKSERDTLRAINRVVRMLKEKGIIIRGRPKIEIQNIVASANLHGLVDLVGFYEKGGKQRGGRVMYEPEQFPGLIYRIENPRSVLLVFSSGKLVCTGTKRETDVYNAVENTAQKLEESGAMTYERPEEAFIKELVTGKTEVKRRR